MVIDSFMPRWHFSESHQAVVRAPRAAAFRAVRQVTAREVRFLGTLMAIRYLPALALGQRKAAGARDQPLLGLALHSGFVLLAEVADQELVMGVIGRFWRPSGGRVSVAGPGEFLAFADPGYARAALNFRLSDHGDGFTRVTTETRIFTPEAEARRRFGAYWFFVHPGSAFIRRRWLAAIKARAEADPRAAETAPG